MNAGLRELLGLPELYRQDPAPNGEFRQAFRDGIAGVNDDLQMVAAQGNPGAHQKLETQRQRLYAAYQTAVVQGDPTTNGRVISAVAKARENSSSEKASTAAGREQWQKREADFAAALDKTGELEDSRHPKAVAYRKIANEILARANGHLYQQATAALDQVLPAINKAHADSNLGNKVETVRADVKAAQQTGRGDLLTELTALERDLENLITKYNIFS